ncbi:hypothetical protein HOG16_04410 [Candidatus Woesearchaeota archaeon]|jgi:hypothetical protein|nr:hypothetical protein [Candidatus Woesearchaeota archaeon]MBT4321843.1 hypothetical protein [Candidatus Woesearchaeota archaeon]
MTLTDSVKKFEWFDISLVKLSTAAFILMVAKLWSGILALEWYWYLIIAVIVAIRPFTQMLKK